MRALAAGLAVALLPAAAAAQQNPFDLMQRLLQQPQPASPGQGYAPASPGANRLQQQATTAPRGDEPTALVEAVSGVRGVELMDYVYPGQVIELGRNGAITLAHFGSCLTETIRGGRAVVGDGQSEVEGGEINVQETPCQGAKPIIVAEASEAGAAAKRLGRDGAPAMREFVLKSGQPVFKWEAAAGQAATVAVYRDGQAQPIWRQKTAARHLSYPAGAPDLEAGEVYRVEATFADGRVQSAMFSIDPGLEVADNPANRLVALGP